MCVAASSTTRRASRGCGERLLNTSPRQPRSVADRLRDLLSSRHPQKFGLKIATTSLLLHLAQRSRTLNPDRAKTRTELGARVRWSARLGVAAISRRERSSTRAVGTTLTNPAPTIPQAESPLSLFAGFRSVVVRVLGQPGGQRHGASQVVSSSRRHVLLSADRDRPRHNSSTWSASSETHGAAAPCARPEHVGESYAPELRVRLQLSTSFHSSSP